MTKAVLINQGPGFKHYKLVPETEQCFCQSYYDDDGVLKDCACRKCRKKSKAKY